MIELKAVGDASSTIPFRIKEWSPIRFADFYDNFLAKGMEGENVANMDHFIVLQFGGSV
jgi:hypothetical protein